MSVERIKRLRIGHALPSAMAQAGLPHPGLARAWAPCCLELRHGLVTARLSSPMLFADRSSRQGSAQSSHSAGVLLASERVGRRLPRLGLAGLTWRLTRMERRTVPR